MKKSRIFIIVFSLCMLLSAVLLCFFYLQPPDDLKEVQKRGVLLAGTTGDYRPMSYLNRDTGVYEGFDIALAEDFASFLNVKIKFIPVSWPELMNAAAEEKFDAALSGITITDERRKKALMSDGYLNNGKTILCRSEDKDKYINLDSVNKPEVRVMENPGGLNQKFAQDNLPKAQLIIHNVNEEIPSLIAEGRADVMITEILEAEYYCSIDSRLAAPVIAAPFTHGRIGALFPKNRKKLLKRFNEFLYIEKQSGRLDELKKIYIQNKNDYN